MSERKTQYADFCSRHYVPLHFQPWWLDAVGTGGAWDVCLALNGNGEVAGALPYYRTQRFGLPLIRQAPLTAYGGPWLHYPPATDTRPLKRYDFEKKALNELIRQLPRTVFFRQNFHPAVTNWMPFYRAGFRQSTRYTYLFPDLTDLEKVRAGFKNTLRTDLKKAEKVVTVQRADASPLLLFDLHRQSFRRQGLRPPYTSETFRRLHAALLERGQVACFIARDHRSGAPHAALCLAFDERSGSVLLTGADPVFKTSSAVWLLFWHALVFCSERGLSLDFEGSMNRRIEKGFRAFGAQLTPYHQITKNEIMG